MANRKISKRKRLENKLDKLWRTIGKGRASCEVCDTLPVHERYNYSQVHPHHIVGRGHKMTRWDLRNRCWLCPSHHTLGDPCAEKNQGGWFFNDMSDEDWMGTHRGEDKSYLMEVRHATKKWTLEELEQFVKELEEDGTLQGS